MKNIIIVLAALALPMSALSVPEHLQSSRLVPSVVPGLANQSSTTQTLITQTDNCEKNFTFDELFTLQKKFLDAFIYPNNTAQAMLINSPLLAEDVQGRVDITRTFYGRELNTEYLFGLFAGLADTMNGSDFFTLLGIPTSYEITHFAASQNIASASTRFQFYFPVTNATYPIQIQTWNVFNAKGEISMYDASFTGWWQWLEVVLLQQASEELSLLDGQNVSIAQTMTYAQDKLATSICGTAQKYCIGTLQQYDNAASCYNYLTTVVPFGQAYELGRNTLQCRMVHQGMVHLRPEVHCPHIGKSGGGYCVDQPSYTETVEADYFTNFKFAYGNGSLSG